MSSSSGLDSLIAEAERLAAMLESRNSSFGFGAAAKTVSGLVSALKAAQAGGMLDGQTIEEWRSIADGYHDRADREAFKRYGLERERDARSHWRTGWVGATVINAWKVLAGAALGAADA